MRLRTFNPELQKQAALCEFEPRLIYKVRSKIAKKEKRRREEEGRGGEGRGGVELGSGYKHSYSL